MTAVVRAEVICRLGSGVSTSTSLKRQYDYESDKEAYNPRKHPKATPVGYETDNSVAKTGLSSFRPVTSKYSSRVIHQSPAGNSLSDPIVIDEDDDDCIVVRTTAALRASSDEDIPFTLNRKPTTQNTHT